MTTEEQLAEARKQIKRMQTFIRMQRARERVTRATRLGLIAGQHAQNIDLAAEEEKALPFVDNAENTFADTYEALKFYAAGGSDNGRKAQLILSTLE